MRRTTYPAFLSLACTLVISALLLAQDKPAEPPAAPAATPPTSGTPGAAPAADAAADESAAKAAAKRDELKAAAEAKKAAAAKARDELKQFNSTVEDAVKQLTAEAKELDDTKTPTHSPVFTRPHPALRGFTGDDAAEILTRMARPFTSNEYRDSYVRWHLSYVVRQAGEGELRRSGTKIIQLINQMPESIKIDIKPWWHDEPEDISREYHRLLSLTRTVVGYPPFERVYWGRAALPQMTAARRVEMTPIVEKLEALRGKWKRVYDNNLLAFNERVRKVNWIVRQYRGELIYTLLLTGDPSMFDRVVSEIGRQVKKKDRAAIDITSFVYLAALDGVLNRYPQSELAKAGKLLEAVARSADGYAVYTNGKFEAPPWAPRKEFNFADYAFHIVHMLEEGPSLYLGTQSPEAILQASQASQDPTDTAPGPTKVTEP